MVPIRVAIAEERSRKTSLTGSSQADLAFQCHGGDPEILTCSLKEAEYTQKFGELARRAYHRRLVISPGLEKGRFIKEGYNRIEITGRPYRRPNCR